VTYGVHFVGFPFLLNVKTVGINLESLSVFAMKIAAATKLVASVALGQYRAVRDAAAEIAIRGHASKLERLFISICRIKA
jgi:hypothetical protein